MWRGWWKRREVRFLSWVACRMHRELSHPCPVVRLCFTVEPVLHDDITTHMCSCVGGTISGAIGKFDVNCVRWRSMIALLFVSHDLWCNSFSHGSLCATRKGSSWARLRGDGSGRCEKHAPGIYSLIYSDFHRDGTITSCHQGGVCGVCTESSELEPRLSPHLSSFDTLVRS